MNGKKLLALCCAAILLLSATACGTAANSNETDSEAVAAALAKLEDCTSCTALQITERGETVTDSGITYEYTGTSTLDIILVSDPEFKMMTETRTTTLFDGEETSQHVISYILPEDGGYREYYFDGTAWYYVFTEDMGAVPVIHVSDIAGMFVLEGLSFRKAKTETLDSGKAVRYDAALAGDELAAYLYNSGYLDSITSMSENQQKKICENLAKDLDALVISIWVDSASGYPVQFHLDMTDTLNGIETSISKTLGDPASETQWIVTRNAMTMILGDFNAVDDITVPAEALDALPYDTTGYTY